MSRSSLLTGRRPDTTQVLQNGGCPFTNNPKHKDWQSLPEYFAKAGYVTAGMGKIFHPNVCDGAAKGEWAKSWTLPYFHPPCISLGSIFNGTCFEDYPFALPPPQGGYRKEIHAYSNKTASDDDLPDGMIANHAIQILRNVSRGDAPFFVAVGFHKPHLPHIAPQKYFDLYDDVSLPEHEFAPKGLPKEAWNPSTEFQTYPDNAAAAKLSGYSETKPLNQSWTKWSRKAYFAAASYTDALVGRVIAELDGLGLANDTVIALWGDHGWHIGENNEWGKHTSFARASRAPLFFSVPGGRAAVVRNSFAEFVDIFPTVVELAGVDRVPLCSTASMSASAPVCTEGASLANVVHSPEGGPAKKAAFYQWKIGKSTGYSIVTHVGTQSFRYTEWVRAQNFSPRWETRTATELYDRTVDPDESVNMAAAHPLPHETTELITHLRQKLHAGWRGSHSSP